jgi:hypothetical protein
MIIFDVRVSHVDAEKGNELVAADDEDETEIDVDDRKDLISAEKGFGVGAEADVVGENGD